MRNRDHSALPKLFRDHSLNDGVILHVDIGSCLIDKDNFALLEECPTNAQQLFLAR
jgi:hypothetical protein